MHKFITMMEKIEALEKRLWDADFKYLVAF